jgi:hypothetical protein
MPLPTAAVVGGAASASTGAEGAAATAVFMAADAAGAAAGPDEGFLEAGTAEHMDAVVIVTVLGAGKEADAGTTAGGRGNGTPPAVPAGAGAATGHAGRAPVDGEGAQSCMGGVCSWFGWVC